MEDRRCAICQQQSDEVFVTRFTGQFTTTLTGPQFEQLQVSCQIRD